MIFVKYMDSNAPPGIPPQSFGQLYKEPQMPRDLPATAKPTLNAGLRCAPLYGPATRNTTHYRKPPGKGNGNPASSSPLLIFKKHTGHHTATEENKYKSSTASKTHFIKVKLLFFLQPCQYQAQLGLLRYLSLD